MWERNFRTVAAIIAGMIASLYGAAVVSEAILPEILDIMGRISLSVSSNPLVFLVASSVVMIGTYFVIDTLRRNLSSLKSEQAEIDEIVLHERTYAEIGGTRNEGATTNVIQLGEEDKARVIESLISANKINLDVVFLERLKEITYGSVIEDSKKRIIRRMEYQVEVLGSRATFSLTWGMLFAAVGIGSLILTFVMFPVRVSYTDWKEYLVTYIPRFTITVIIELIAFFFLRLYAKALTEIRYIQNEITNIESKLMAHSTAMTLGEKSLIKTSVESVLSTERNFIIDKGQTTVEIERERADAAGLADTLKAASTIIHGGGTAKASS